MKIERASVTAILRRVLQFPSGSAGNIAALSALIVPVLVISLGTASDYIAATRREEQLRGIADAAALAAVTPQMLSQTAATAQAASDAMFDAQSTSVQGVAAGGVSRTVTVTDVASGSSVLRTAQVNFTSASSNVFAQILGIQSLALNGEAVAQNTLSPHLNIHLLLDTSPSMGIGATQADITTMVNATPNQQGCAFACHESDLTADTDEPLYNPVETASSCVNGSSFPQAGVAPTKGYNGKPYGAEDNYALARCLGVTLRIDNVNDAVQQLIPLAQTTQTTYNTTYTIDMYSIDQNFNQIQAASLPANTPVCDIASGSLASGATAPGCASPTTVALQTLSQLEVSKNNANNDEFSYLDTGIENMYSILTNSGTSVGGIGTAAAPKQVLIIVSDAVPDWAHPTNRTPFVVINTPTFTPPGTGEATDYCSAIKNANIQIAFLYLVYYPLPTNGYYMGNIAPLQGTSGCTSSSCTYDAASDQFAQAAQSCASPGLFTAVSVGGDVTGALNALFLKAAQIAYLSH
jgi:Flp pilus assembly protein TadG